ncbi:aldo/keto reductase [Deltaproteobacteria bacterium]|nr:aldo/keto reductase [Deltaproteobacteria bacterium]
MRKISFGRTNLQVTEVAFGALPIQRVSFEEAAKILRRAYDAGINFFDTARGYSDSEEKMGLALSPVRKNIIIASKSQGKTGDVVSKHIETSLKNLKTNYLDLIQIHNPDDVPLPDDGTGRYEAMVKARDAGKVRFIGLTNHSLDRVTIAAKSGLYDTIQYPFSMISMDRELGIAKLCQELNLGFIAMKAMSGGLIRNVPAAFAFMRRFPNVVPIWGIQKMEELEEFLALEANPPVWDEAMRQAAEQERAALGKDFCRSCGYCMPCPEAIPIRTIARMILLLGRSPWEKQTTPEAQQEMAKSENCTNCGTCASRCPYELDTPRLVRENYAYYKQFIAEKKACGLLT